MNDFWIACQYVFDHRITFTNLSHSKNAYMIAQCHTTWF